MDITKIPYNDKSFLNETESKTLFYDKIETKITNITSYTTILGTGSLAKIHNTGDVVDMYCHGCNTNVINSGKHCKISLMKRGGYIENYGNNCSIIVHADSPTIINHGNVCKIHTLGNGSQVRCDGEKCTIYAHGFGDIVIASLGTIVNISDVKYNKENNTFETERELMYIVDGRTYKPDTYYTVKDGIVQETDVRDKF